MAELLILKGANVNAVSTGKSWTGRKWTPLNYAIRRSQKGIAVLLILKGANINAVDKKGGTPSHWANHVGHEEVVELLIKHGGQIIYIGALRVVMWTGILYIIKDTL